MKNEYSQAEETLDKDRERILGKVKAYFETRLDNLHGSEEFGDEEIKRAEAIEGILRDMDDENFESASQFLKDELDGLKKSLQEEMDEQRRARLEVWQAEVQDLWESLSLQEK